MKEEKRLSTCEELIMAEIWKAGEIDMQGIRERMKEKGHDWMPQTVSTFLHRLKEKGYIQGRKEGRNTSFCPLTSKTEYAEKLYRGYREFCQTAGVERK